MSVCINKHTIDIDENTILLSHQLMSLEDQEFRILVLINRKMFFLKTGDRRCDWGVVSVINFVEGTECVSRGSHI